MRSSLPDLGEDNLGNYHSQSISKEIVDTGVSTRDKHLVDFVQQCPEDADGGSKGY